MARRSGRWHAPGTKRPSGDGPGRVHAPAMYTLVLLAPVVACGSPRYVVPDTAPVAAAPPPAIRNADGVSDAAIADAVRRALAAEDVPALKVLGVGVQGGRVTLTGSVPNVALERRALAAAESMQGVLAVRSDLAISGAVRPDAEVAADLRAAIRAIEGAGGGGTRVENGVVVLQGVVRDGEARAAAYDAAMTVVGVRDVRNLLRVGGDQRRSDAAVALDVEQRLRARGVGDSVAVDVRDGEVTLRGAVDSARVRRAVIAAAWGPGVESVVVQRCRRRIRACQLPATADPTRLATDRCRCVHASGSRWRTIRTSTAERSRWRWIAGGSSCAVPSTLCSSGGARRRSPRRCPG